MDEIFVPNGLPSPLAGPRGGQWSVARAWRDDGYEILRGMTHAWETRVMLVYIMLRFLVVGLDGGQTLFTKYIAMLFFDLMRVKKKTSNLLTDPPTR